MAPRWLTALLNRVVPPVLQDDVVGDLEELHGRRRARSGSAIAVVVTVMEGLGLGLYYATYRVFTALRHPGWISGPELRLALRLVRKQPVMTLTSVIALGMGIGIASGAFSVFQQGLFGRLPYENGDRFVRIDTRSEGTGRRAGLELEQLRLMRASASAFRYIGGYATGDFNLLREDDGVERVVGAKITPQTFAHLPYVPVAGRMFTTEDGRSGSPGVALIRESLWSRSYGRSADVIGQTINVAGQPHTVVGVLPDDAGYPNDGEIWIALDEVTLGALNDRDPVQARLVGVLADEASSEQANVQVSQISNQASAAGRGVDPVRSAVVPFSQISAGPQVQAMIAAFVSVLVAVLLIIAANVGNLVIARTSRRAGELAVRTALGASRSRLVTQLFMEVLVVGFFAAILGLGTAAAVLRMYDGMLEELPFWVQLHLDPVTVGVVAGLTLLACAVVGVLPALRATGRDPGSHLRAGGAGSGLTIGRVGGAMIAVEVGLSVALLGVAIMFARGFAAFVDPVFNIPEDRVLTAQIYVDVTEADLSVGGARTPGDSILRVVSELRAALAELPTVTASTVATGLPRTSPFPEPMNVEGVPNLVSAPAVFVGDQFFDVLQVEPLVGRFFYEADMGRDALPIAVVNEAFATEHFGTTQVVGRRIRLAEEADENPDAPWYEIVGVAPNVLEVSGPVGAAGVYFPFQGQRLFNLAVKATADPMALAAPLRRIAFDLDPHLSVSRVVPLERVGEENRTALLSLSSAMTGIGVIALLLSLAGVYSIVSLAVTQRTREIGVRVALGAEPKSILWEILRRSGLLILVGATVGSVAGWQMATARGLFTFNLPEVEIWLFPALIGIVVAAGAVACWIPSRRALAIQPIEALRYDT